MVRLDDRRQRFLILAFDGTGNDGTVDAEYATNIHKLRKQIDALNDPRVRVEYLEGPGTQPDALLRLTDAALGHSSPERVDDMYRRAVERVNAWHEIDPDIQTSFLTIGFSRGGSQAPAFANLMHSRGIPDITSEAFDADGTPHYTRNLIEPGHARQALGMLDPVATGGPMLLDRRPAAALYSAFQISALDERRGLFPADMVLPFGTSVDGRFLHVRVAGAHADIGGGYLRDGLAIRSGNLLADYCNGLCDHPILTRMPEPQDPQRNVIHRSEESMLL